MHVQTVSVVIPCFNQGHFLAEAIDSVFAQTLPASELLIIDDGSTDNTPAVARRYGSARYLAQPNLGLARARNRGLRAARSEYLVFLDADDRLRPGALEAGVKALEAHPAAALTYGRCQRIDERGRPLPTGTPAPLGPDIYASLLRNNPIWTPAAAMFRRETGPDVLHFDPAVNASADYELYLRLARRRALVEHTAVVAEYRQHRGSMSSDAALMLTSTLKVLHAQRTHLDTPDRLRAFRAGVRNFRELYGDQIVEDMRKDWRYPPRWPRLAVELVTLVRHYPGGVALHAKRKLQRVLEGTNGSGTGTPRPSRFPGR